MADFMSMKISGMEDFERNLKLLPGILQKRVVLQSFRAGVKIIHEQAVANAPKSHDVKEGNKKHLSEKITIRRPTAKSLKDNREIIFSIKVTHPLAVLAEYGTGQRFRKKSGGATGAMPAYAYMRRAVDVKATIAINVITDECRRLLNKAINSELKRIAGKK